MSEWVSEGGKGGVEGRSVDRAGRRIIKRKREGVGRRDGVHALELTTEGVSG